MRLAALHTAALALATLPLAAHAQSSVTFYGILDAGITYVSNAGGSHQVKFDDGVSYGNRWGLMGTEDLGGGAPMFGTFAMCSPVEGLWTSSVAPSSASRHWPSI